MSIHKKAAEKKIAAHIGLSFDLVPTSWEKSIELLDYLNTVIDPSTAVEFAIKRIAPGEHSRNAEHVTVARKLNVSKNTVENWRTGCSRCSIPLRLTVAAAKTFNSPECALASLSAFTGEDHAAHFGWAS